MIKLTELELKVLICIDKARVSFFDDGLAEDSNGWTDTLAEELTYFLDINAQAVGGVISSMIQKNIFRSTGDSVWLTAAGVEAYAAID